MNSVDNYLSEWYVVTDNSMNFIFNLNEIYSESHTYSLIIMSSHIKFINK